MDKRLQTLFHGLQAETSLKEKTAMFLQDKRRDDATARKAPRFRLIAALCLFALVLLVGAMSFALYYTPSAYIDLDVNPSIGFAVNRFGRVIQAKSYNDDGDSVLQIADIMHKPYKEVSERLIKPLIEQGFLTQDSLVSVTVQTESRSLEQELIETMKTTVNRSITDHHAHADTDVFPVSSEVRRQAQEVEVTPAKYLAIEALQQVDPSATFESCANHSVSEIRKLAKAHGRHRETAPSEPQSPESAAPDLQKNRNEDRHGGKRANGKHSMNENSSNVDFTSEAVEESEPALQRADPDQRHHRKKGGCR